MPHTSSGAEGEPPPLILHLGYDARFLVLAYGVSIMGAIAAGMHIKNAMIRTYTHGDSVGAANDG